MPRFVDVLARSGLVLVVVAAMARDSCAEQSLRFNESSGFVEVAPESADLRRLLRGDLAGLAPKYLSIHVDAEAASGLPAVVGSYEFDGKWLRFKPRYAFRPGLRYVARFDVKGRLPQESPSPPSLRLLRFSIPRTDAVRRHRIVNVFPSAEQLPENLLKFYVHFSGAMSRGEAYQRIRLIDDGGQMVELAFLEISEELWDPDGKRLTLLFDPGRVKRGLKPRAEDGQVLEVGRRYTLRIDADWRDASGQTLQNAFEKKFVVTPADYGQPDPVQWSLTAPAAQTKHALVVEFSEPLDHAMLSRVLTVVDARDQLVVGSNVIDRQETRWSFRPDAEWTAGHYQLRFDAALEDVAGNSVGRPFEVEAEQSLAPVVHGLTFEIRQAP